VNFNVYLDDATAKRLDALARREKVARNALIRRAVDALLAQSRQHWPDVVMNWTGEPEAVPYESLRSELRPPDDDPLGVADGPIPARPGKRASAGRRARRST